MPAIVSIEARPFWDALRDRRLLIQQCGACSRLRHYPVPMCPHCHSLETGWQQACGRGTLYSWTTTHSSKLAGFSDQVPYTIATVELQEGVRMAAPLRQDPAARLRIGMPVELIFECNQNNDVLPAFILS